MLLNCLVRVTSRANCRDKLQFRSSANWPGFSGLEAAGQRGQKERPGLRPCQKMGRRAPSEPSRTPRFRILSDQSEVGKSKSLSNCLFFFFQDSFRPIGSGQIKKPVPYTPDVPLKNGNSKASLQYNNPGGLYGNNNGEGALPKQMAALNLSSPHSPEPQVQSPSSRNGFDPESAVYKMLQDPEEPVSAPKQSGSFRYLQGILEAEDGGVSPTERMRSLRSPIKSPVPKLGSPIPVSVPGLQKLSQCTRCGIGIVGTIVKARDKLYHPECFMCDDCGLNLKQRGYFFIEESLYCETHAKARVQPPEGYDVVAVYPNSKVELV
ncbi:PDZ and LIM domain protein 4 isoform X2 [Anguilla rostrata]|uniref:PDZ and LIM domain protein 4 isoform X2 n=1 Tax=Anguilla rostrata TaxID=7938 RepID=UPI0030CD4916